MLLHYTTPGRGKGIFDARMEFSSWIRRHSATAMGVVSAISLWTDNAVSGDIANVDSGGGHRYFARRIDDNAVENTIPYGTLSSSSFDKHAQDPDVRSQAATKLARLDQFHHQVAWKRDGVFGKPGKLKKADGGSSQHQDRDTDRANRRWNDASDFWRDSNGEAVANHNRLSATDPWAEWRSWRRPSYPASSQPELQRRDETVDLLGYHYHPPHLQRLEAAHDCRRAAWKPLLGPPGQLQSSASWDRVDSPQQPGSVRPSQPWPFIAPEQKEALITPPCNAVIRLPDPSRTSGQSLQEALAPPPPGYVFHMLYSPAMSNPATLPQWISSEDSAPGPGNSSRCVWMVRAFPGWRLTLSVRNVSWAGSSDCNSTSVSVLAHDVAGDLKPVLRACPPANRSADVTTDSNIAILNGNLPAKARFVLHITLTCDQCAPYPYPYPASSSNVNVSAIQLVEQNSSYPESLLLGTTSTQAPRPISSTPATVVVPRPLPPKGQSGKVTTTTERPSSTPSSSRSPPSKGQSGKVTSATTERSSSTSSSSKGQSGEVATTTERSRITTSLSSPSATAPSSTASTASAGRLEIVEMATVDPASATTNVTDDSLDQNFAL